MEVRRSRFAWKYLPHPTPMIVGGAGGSLEYSDVLFEDEKVPVERCKINISFILEYVVMCGVLLMRTTPNDAVCTGCTSALPSCKYLF